MTSENVDGTIGDALLAQASAGLREQIGAVPVMRGPMPDDEPHVPLPVGPSTPYGQRYLGGVGQLQPDPVRPYVRNLPVAARYITDPHHEVTVTMTLEQFEWIQQLIRRGVQTATEVGEGARPAPAQLRQIFYSMFAQVGRQTVIPDGPDVSG